MNGSPLIPSKFRLNDKWVKVVIDDEYCKEKWYLGAAQFEESRIVLCHRAPKGRILKKITKEKTYFHELIHQVLHSMGKDYLKWNEDFVDLFAERLWEYEKTKR